jgi:hypothetical protein
MISVSIWNWNLSLFSEKSLFSRPLAKDVQNVMKRKKEISMVRAMRKTSFMLYACQKSATDRLRNSSTEKDQTRQSIKFLTISFLKSQITNATEN